MALKTIEKYVVEYSELPSDLVKNHWINEHFDIEYLEVHIEEEGSDDPLSLWLEEKYPELKEEWSFYIHMNIE